MNAILKKKCNITAYDHEEVARLMTVSYVLHALIIFLLMGTVQPVVGPTLTCCEVVQRLQPTFVTAISQWSTCGKGR